ncbi:MAG: Ig-like domain-containing protein [bacterium]
MDTVVIPPNWGTFERQNLGAGVVNAVRAVSLDGTQSDRIPPQLEGAESITNSRVNLYFSEEMDPATAQNRLNYAIAGEISGLPVEGAVLLPDRRTVQLTTSPQAGGEVYRAQVSGIRDANLIPINPWTSEAYFIGVPTDKNLTSRENSGIMFDNLEAGFPGPLSSRQAKDGKQTSGIQPAQVTSECIDSGTAGNANDGSLATYWLGEGAAPGMTVRLKFEMYSDDSITYPGFYLDDVTVEDPVAGVLFSDDLESGVGQWTIFNYGAGDPWHLVSCDYRSPSNSLFSGEGACSNYVDNKVTAAISAPIDLTGADSPVSRFWSKYDLETDYDFVDLFLCVEGVDTCDAPFSGRLIASFTGSNFVWTSSEYPLTTAGTGGVFLQGRLANPYNIKGIVLRTEPGYEMTYSVAVGYGCADVLADSLTEVAPEANRTGTQVFTLDSAVPATNVMVFFSDASPNPPKVAELEVYGEEVSPEINPPAVSITSPAGNAILRGAVNITGQASDDTQLDKVEVYANNSLLCTAYDSPFSCPWMTTGTADGAFQISAKAYDIFGNQRTTPPLPVTVDNEGPEARVTSPSAGAFVRGTVPLRAQAQDDTAGIARVEFQLDDSATPICTATNGTNGGNDWTCPWDTTTTTSEAHALFAEAFDPAGNKGASSPVGVTVDNQPPAGQMIVPSAGATVAGTIVLTAQASDNSHFLDRVEFLLDGAATPICTSTNGTNGGSDWTCSWNSATAGLGPHQIHARAYDKAGNSADSAPNSFTVSQGALGLSKGANSPPASTTALKGQTDRPMLQLAMTALPVEDVHATRIQLTASGDGNDVSDISSVKVWLDANGNGQKDAGDSLLGSGTYTANNGAAAIALNRTITKGTSESWLVTYDVASTIARAPETRDRKGLWLATLFAIPLLLLVLPVGLSRRAVRFLCLMALIGSMLSLTTCGGGGGGGPAAILRTYIASLAAPAAVTANGVDSSTTIQPNGAFPITGTTLTVQK